eukprot:jgi/Tetstr1/423945/TSEL_014556.t1
MFVLINRLDRLAISTTNPSQPKNWIDRPSEAAIIGTIMARLPIPTQAGIEPSAIKLRDAGTTFAVLDRHLK